MELYLQKDVNSFTPTSMRRERVNGVECLRFDALVSSTSEDQDGDVIESEAWADTRSQGKVPMLSNHDTKSVIGHWAHLKPVDEGLRAVGILPVGNPEGAKWADLIETGSVDGVSVGFKVPDKRLNIIERSVDDKKGKRKQRVIKKAALVEISLTPFPCSLESGIGKSSSVFGEETQIWIFLKNMGFSGKQIESVIEMRTDAQKDEAKVAAALGDLLRKLERA